jgi:hypothetical protein
MRDDLGVMLCLVLEQGRQDIVDDREPVLLESLFARKIDPAFTSSACAATLKEGQPHPA